MPAISATSLCTSIRYASNSSGEAAVNCRVSSQAKKPKRSASNVWCSSSSRYCVNGTPEAWASSGFRLSSSPLRKFWISISGAYFFAMETKADFFNRIDPNQPVEKFKNWRRFNSTHPANGFYPAPPHRRFAGKPLASLPLPPSIRDWHGQAHQANGYILATTILRP